MSGKAQYPLSLLKDTQICLKLPILLFRSWAILKAEYEYTDCSNRIMSVEKFHVNGFSLWTEDFHGYSLNIHHR